MGGMHLTSTLDFAATPDAVSSMLTDRAYLEQVCQESDAVEYSVDVSGSVTSMRRVLHAPPAAAKFTGSTITIEETTAWSAPGADGSRKGDVRLGVPGLPVEMIMKAELRPGGRGTTIAYDGDLTVNIPFVGKKLEQSAEPAVLSAIRLQQRVGDAWLAERG